MPGRVLVDNLAAALPDHAQHGAALGGPAADDAQRAVNTGHGPLGWTLAAGSARLLAVRPSTSKKRIRRIPS